MKKVLKFSLISLLILSLVGLLFVTIVISFALTKNKTEFSLDKIRESTICVQVYDSNNVLVKEDSSQGIKKMKINTLPIHVKDAFISIEDKQFYRHNGINPKRMIKAFFSNLKHMKLKEGASTITQQLIKNTHLSSKKTLSRKINEIVLALKLEKNMSKEEILENYLNVIYFGDNCYGIENASEHYFSKHAKELTLAEASTLAGMIKSPHGYSPVSKQNACLKRRNLVLGELLKDGKISQAEYTKNVTEPISLKLSSNLENRLNSYSENAITEASRILKLPAKQIALGGYKIYTFQNSDKQKALADASQNVVPSSEFAGISINSKTGAVEAYIGRSSFRILEQKRQPGSVIKPLIVYAPAINENVISPATKILDEPISTNGYSPKNFGGGYLGYISAREALSKSLNIPTVKIGSYVGIDKMKFYAKNLGISLDEKDDGYAICLGGLTYGESLLNLAGAYTSLANEGKYVRPQFVNYIADDNGKIVYKTQQIEKQVFRDDTAYLVTDMLKTAVKAGTAKKLASLPFDVASKTGTVGTKNGNTDAYNISYTTQDVVGVWVGNMDNSFIQTMGGGAPTELVKEYLAKINTNKKPSGFLKPNSVQEVELDSIELEKNHKVVKANSLVPEKYRIKDVFSKFNLPEETSENYLSVLPATLKGEVKNGKVTLKFTAQSFLEYEIYKVQNGKEKLLKKIEQRDGEQEISDILSPKERAKYYIVTKITNYTLGSTTAEEKSPEIELYAQHNSNDKWFLQKIHG